MSGPNTNLTNRIAARKPLAVIEVFQASHFGEASGGVITLTSARYVLMAEITMSDRLLIPDDASVEIVGATLVFTAITYTGTGKFISTNPGEFANFIILRDVLVFGVGTGAMFDVDLGGDFAVIQVVALITAGIPNPGRIGGSDGVISFDGFQFLGIEEGFTVEAAESTFKNGTLSDGGTVGALLRVLAPSAVVNLDDIIIFTGASAAGVYIDPAINTAAVSEASDASVVIRSFAVEGDGPFYEVGTTEPLTLFADAAVASTTIDSVTDNGGQAQFDFTVGPTLYIGQEVVISGFVTETTYNGTYIITAVGAGTFEVGLAFTGTEAAVAAFTSDSVTVTSASHGLSDGQSVLISDVISANYLGGFSLYNTQTNTAQINATFDTPETSGTWSTGSLVESDPRMEVSASTTPDSRTIGSLIVQGNTAATVITVLDQWEDLNLGGIAASGSNIERWTVIDATTGEIRYDGINPFNGSQLMSVSAVSSGGTQEFEFRIVDQDGNPFPDAVAQPTELGSVVSNVMLLIPADSVAKGNTIRVQARNVSGTSNVTVTHISGEIV